MTTDINKIKQRIQDLLAVAENRASTEGEVTNAMRFAEILMRKHNLERSDIKPKSDGTFDIDDVKMNKQFVTLVGVKRTQWELALANMVQNFVGTVNFFSSTDEMRLEPNGAPVDSDLHGPMFGAATAFYGPKEDVQLACQLFRDMGLRIAHYGKTKFGGFARGPGASYCQGFVSGLREANQRVEREKIEQKDTRTPGENAMILADNQLKTQLRVASRNWLSLPAADGGGGVKLVRGSGLQGSSRNNRAFTAGVRDGKQTKMSRNSPSRID